MAAHRHALPPLKLVTALGTATLAVATITSLAAPAVARPTAPASASCSHRTDWNTMVPDGQCPTYRS
ncbi:MAG: hypothetical protein HOV83_15290 [Catenulispora sp.]|nr:hypothetical protein [Catenulispora sp.]